MADQSYVYVNSNINVDVIKVDQVIENFNTAIANKDQMLNTTILFNDFTELLDARYFSPESVTSGASYSIYRKTPTQTYYDFVCVMTNGEYIFKDYNINNNNYYHYLCSIELTSSSGLKYLIYQNKNEDGSIEYINTNWDEWSICDIDETTESGIYTKVGSTWNFRCNVSGEDLTQNTSVTVWDTLGRYPKISIGKKNYDSGTFSALLGDVTEYKVYEKNDSNEDNSNSFQAINKYGYTEKIDLISQYSREMEKLNSWREFCNNGSLKLLKDVKGNSWIVQIQENSKFNINLQPGIMPTTISFDWVEVEDISNTSIIYIEGSNNNI